MKILDIGRLNIRKQYLTVNAVLLAFLHPRMSHFSRLSQPFPVKALAETI